jgi:hypothetical protein
MPRRDNASNYLTGLIACAQRLKGRNWSGATTPLTLIGDRDLRRLTPDIDVNNPSLHAAFETFGLDPSEPNNWRLLLALLAECFFVPKNQRGGEKWTSEQLCQLLADIGAVKKANPDIKGDSKICDRVKEQFDRYAGIRAGTIRRKLQDARNPKHNRWLGKILEAHKPDPRGMTADELKAFVLQLITERWAEARGTKLSE